MADPSPLSHSPPARPRVLVVDENPDLCDSMALLLEAAGFDVVTAATARDGTQLFEAHRPDAVLSELRLQDVDGLELGRRLRALSGPGTLLIAHTGWAMPGIRHRAQQAGFDGFVLKPADPDALVALLRQACRDGAPRLSPPAAPAPPTTTPATTASTAPPPP